MNVADVLQRTLFPHSPIRIKEITTHSSLNGKKTKLTTAIYTMEYINGDKPDFTTNEKDILNQLSFNLWQKN
jgi:hypothetical protein